MKRILGGILAAVLLLSLLPAGVFAQSAFTLGADSAEILNCGGKVLHADGTTYFSEDGCVSVDGVPLFYADASNLNRADGALFFTRAADGGFEICRFDLASQTTEVLLSRAGTVRQMYVVSGAAFYYLSDHTIYRAENGQEEVLLTDEGLWSFVPTPYGLVYAVGTLFEYSIHAGNTLVTDCAREYHVDFDADEPRLVYTTVNGDYELPLRAAFGGDTTPDAYTGYGEVDVSAMLGGEYNETPEEIAAEELTAQNAARQTRAFNGAQGDPGALRPTLTQGQQNAQKRAYQMTDIEWTPKANVLGWGSGLTYSAGTTYKGLPYGQPVYASYVPWSTDLTGFITAVNNASSKMYTDYSSYNKRAPYYSTDCSAFVSWALNMGSRQTTSTIASKGTLISSSSYANIQVGDYLNNAGSHVVICTDVTYDTGGAINGIEISEATVVSATKYCCQRTWYGTGYGNSLSYFTTKYFNGGYSLYRANNISSVPYSHVCVSPVYGDVCSVCGYGVSGGSSGSSNTTKFGIDVSAHQGTIDWDTVAPQIDFAILRVGYGSDYTNQDDSQWANNVAACERLGIPYGVYLYSYADTAAKAASEAQHVIRLLQGHNPTLPVFYDLEDSTTASCGNANIYQFATIFCNAIEAAGYIPGVYANLNWWRNYLTDPGYDQWYRWVAQYNTACTYTGTYCMWQNSSSYQMSGITANTVDTNYWYGPFPNGGGSTQPSGTYTVTYKVPTDYAEVGTATVTAGDLVTLPSISTRVCGYTFMGWTTSAVSATTECPAFYYAGQSFTPTKNTTLRAVFCYYKDGNTIKGDIYYPACSSSQTGLAAGLSEAGATDTSYTYRSQHVAPVNFVYDYSGTAAQNTALLNLLKAGMLVNPEAVSSYTAYYNTTPGVCKRATATTTVAATCTTSGTKVTSCACCGYSKTSTINPLGHNYATVITPPTCQTSGYTTYTCKREGCGDSYVGDEVPPGDHSLAFMDLGNGTHKQYCTVCETVISTGVHTYENNYCTLCGAYNSAVNYAGTYYIAAKRTNDTNWHYLTSTLSSTAPSSSRYVIADSGVTELPSAIASPEADKAFTLTKNQDGTYLIKAEGIYNGQNYLGWTSGNTGTFVTQENAIRATVTGQPDGYVYISFVDTAEVTHYLAFNATASTLYAAWYTSQMKNLYLVPVTGTIPQHTHSYESEITTAPTCTVAGVRTYTCACGDTYTEPIAAPGHDWQAGTPIAATCTSEGYTPLTCTRCGSTDLENITSALGHSYAYRDNGNGTHTYYCSRCDTVLDAAEPCVFENGVCLGCGHVKATASNGDFALVTQAPDDWSGKYLIVNESRAIAFDGSLAAPNAKTNYHSVTISDGVIAGSDTVRGYAVTVEKIAGTNYYTILLGSGKYMGSTGSSTGINATSTQYQNAISLDADGNAVIANTSGTNTYNFRFNTGSTSDRFAFYGATTGLPVRLYRCVQIDCQHSYTSAVTTSATCTVAGVMTYTCALCGDSYTETIPATGHSLTYTDNGNGTHTVSCANCAYSATSSHTYTNGVCVCGSIEPAAQEFRILSAQPRINEDVNLIYTVSIPDGYLNPYMVFTFLGMSVTVRDYTINEKGNYCFELTRILPQYMGENIRAVLHATNGGADVTDEVAAYSIRQYCANQLVNYPDDTKLKTLLSDLLTYGAAAQQYVGYKTNELVTSGLSLTPSAFSTLSGKTIAFSGAADADAEWKSATLVLQNTIAMRFYFTAASVDGLTVRCAINGRTQSFTNFGYNENSGLYYADVSGIEATEFDDTVTAAFYRNGAQTGTTVSYSVNAYICSAQNSENEKLRMLVRALYNYGASARAYANEGV